MSEEIPPFEPYAVAGVGTVIAHEGETYVVQVASGAVHGYRAPGGTPSQENAAADIAFAIANPPAFPNPVPQAVTRRQLLLVLNSIGVTRAAIRAMLAGNEAALIEFDEASSFDRDHPLVAQLATALGMNAGQVDDIFRNAAQL